MRNRTTPGDRARRARAKGKAEAWVLAVGLVAGMTAVGAFATEKPAATSPAWDSMKSLQGEWEGSYEGKAAAKATYRLVSGGTVLMETLSGADHSEMITMYHPEGSGLLMTHYCSENNQPRMRAASEDGRRIAFRFLDASNLAGPEAPRMTALVVTMKDADHFTQEWTHSGHGKDMTATFAFARKK